MNRAAMRSPRLDAGFGPAATFLGFDGGDEPSTAKAREVGRVAIGYRGGERLDRGSEVVVAHDTGGSVEPHGLAVGAGAVSEEQGMLADQAGEGITEHTLQEALQLAIIVGDAAKEGFPDRAIAVWCYSRA
jgi:hypothetical protein